MPEQFESPLETNLEDELVVNETEKEKIARLADKAARKSTEREKEFDKDHSLFTH